jgi:hypothetical protein
LLGEVCFLWLFAVFIGIGQTCKVFRTSQA